MSHGQGSSCGGRCGPGCGLGPVVVRALAIVGAATTLGLAHSGLRPYSLSLSATPSDATTRHAPPAPVTDMGAEAKAPAPIAAAPTAEAPLPEGFIDTARAKALHDRMYSQGDVVFVDARNADEHAAGHIPGSLHIPPDAFFGGALPPAMDQAPKSFTIVVYCGGGECDASKLVALRFKEQGYADVLVYKQGYTGWSAQKMPSEKGGG